MAPRVGLHLTDRCQLDCDHCVRDPGGKPVDLPLEVIDVVLRDAAALGIRRVSMTGGEPTLHPRFPEILDRIVAHGMSWDIVSNGRRFDRVARWLDEVPARRAACGRIGLSLDGATAETHDAIRGPGQHREVLAAMAICVAEGIPFAITTTLHARNAHELEAIAREGTALGAEWVRFAVLQPTGTHLDREMFLDAAAWRALRERILALAPELPVRLAEGWPRDGDDTLCGALRGETLHVDHHGRLTLCCAQSQAPGDDRPTIAGDVHRGLAPVLPALDALRARTIDARSSESHRSPGDAWSGFGCNACLARFGRPHWTDDGPAGADAVRARWRGVWTRDTGTKNRERKKFLPTAD